MKQPVLTVLVATIPERWHQFAVLMDILEAQIAAAGADVELLGFYDNKHRTVGEKRNALLTLAQGRFITFVDDDDEVSHDYIVTITSMIDEHPDAHVLCFTQNVTINDSPPKPCIYGVEYTYVETPTLWTGKPAHTMVWARYIAQAVRFPDESFGEDLSWVKLACALVDPRRQYRTEKTLYHYNYRSQKSATPSMGGREAW